MVFMKSKNMGVHHVEAPPAPHGSSEAVVELDADIGDEALALLNDTATSTSRRFVRR